MCCSSSCPVAVVPRNGSCDDGRYVKHRIWTSDSHEHSSSRCRMNEAECVSHGMTIKAENLLLIKLFYWPIHSWHCQWAVVDSVYKLNSERFLFGSGGVPRYVDCFPWEIRMMTCTVRHGIKTRHRFYSKDLNFSVAVMSLRWWLFVAASYVSKWHLVMLTRPVVYLGS